VSFSRSRCHGGLFSVIGPGLSCGGRADFSSLVGFGKIVLSGMRAGGDVDFDGAAVKVSEGAAIRLDGMSCGGDLSFRHGSHCAGGIVVDRGRIDGDVLIEAADVTSALILRKGRKAEPAAILAEPACEGGDEAVRLPEAERLEASQFDEVAFGFARGRCRRLVMVSSGEAPGLRGIVDLSQAQVELLIDDPALWPPAHGERLTDEAGEAVEGLILDGFDYARLETTASALSNDELSQTGRFARGSLDAGLPDRLVWLDSQLQRDLHAGLKRQPWRKLADHYRREGRDQDAETIELALRRLAAASPAVSPRRRLVLWFYDLSCEFGTNAYRPIAWIVLSWLVLGSTVWGVDAICQQGGCGAQAAFEIADLRQPQPKPQSLPELQPFVYAADRLLPFADFGQANRYRPNPQWLAVSGGGGKVGSATPGGAETRWSRPVSAGLLMAVFETFIQLFCGLMLILFAGSALRAVSDRGRRGA